MIVDDDIEMKDETNKEPTEEEKYIKYKKHQKDLEH